VAVQLNHHIVYASDPEASARFLTDVLGLAPPTRFDPFVVVQTANGVNLDFLPAQGAVASNHYAFLVSEDEFDQILGRIRDRELDFFADPGAQQRGEINRHDGGRGVYWADPDGHWLEIITRPYGSGAP
jgi:catechol 2,3-dioxygenase-like lactoylglutathione lyase family enzyme